MLNPRIADIVGIDSYVSVDLAYVNRFALTRVDGRNWQLARRWIAMLSDYENDDYAHLLGFDVKEVDKWMKNEGMMECLRLLREEKKNGLMDRSLTKDDIRAIYIHAFRIASQNQDVRSMLQCAKLMSELEGLHINKHEVTAIGPTTIHIIEDAQIEDGEGDQAAD